MEAYYVGAYWMPRSESVESCSVRSGHYFSGLSQCDPSFDQWFMKGKTRQAALIHRFDPRANAIAALFMEQARQEGRLATEGFSVNLWNGQPDDDSSGLSLNCGGSSRRLPNVCLLDPPQQGPVAERLLQAATLARILRAMVLAWEPQWGVVTSDDHRGMMSETAEAGTFVGWLTYFSRARGPLPPLPSAVQVEPVGDLGSLVILTPERFSLTQPTHLELAREVSARLVHAGLLVPLRPEFP